MFLWKGTLEILAKLWFKCLQGKHFQPETEVALTHGHRCIREPRRGCAVGDGWERVERAAWRSPGSQWSRKSWVQEPGKFSGTRTQNSPDGKSWHSKDDADHLWKCGKDCVRREASHMPNRQPKLFQDKVVLLRTSGRVLCSDWPVLSAQEVDM